jgi:MarR family transcriptional regulator for hemolysin
MKANVREGVAARLSCLTDAVLRGGGTSVHAFLEDEGVTVGQLKALRVLEGHDDAVSVGGLAAGLSLSLPTASRIVDALTRHGWVERRVCSEDRRARDLVLTEAGRELVERFAAARAADVRVFVDNLSEAQCRRLDAALSSLDLDVAVPA